MPPSPPASKSAFRLLQVLEVMQGLDHSIDHVVWPSTLTLLIFPDSFNHPIAFAVFPSGLQELRCFAFSNLCSNFISMSPQAHVIVFACSGRSTEYLHSTVEVKVDFRSPRALTNARRSWQLIVLCGNFAVVPIFTGVPSTILPKLLLTQGCITIPPVLTLVPLCTSLYR